MNEHNCRVCGLYFDDYPWGEKGDCPTYEICPCCGVEFGNEDYKIESTKDYRKIWLSKGAKWFNPVEKPENWNLAKQLENVPYEYL